MLAAGAVLPPNPGELLESRAMDTVLEQAKSVYDLVVIDTPPLNAVSDAFPLLRKVDGVVVIGRIGYSRRDAAEQSHQVLASSGALLLGVIANGAKAGGSDAYYSRDRGSSGAVAADDGASSSQKVGQLDATIAGQRTKAVGDREPERARVAVLTRAHRLARWQPFRPDLNSRPASGDAPGAPRHPPGETQSAPHTVRHIRR